MSALSLSNTMYLRYVRPDPLDNEVGFPRELNNRLAVTEKGNRLYFSAIRDIDAVGDDGTITKIQKKVDLVSVALIGEHSSIFAKSIPIEITYSGIAEWEDDGVKKVEFGRVWTTFNLNNNSLIKAAQFLGFNPDKVDLSIFTKGGILDSDEIVDGSTDLGSLDEFSLGFYFTQMCQLYILKNKPFEAASMLSTVSDEGFVVIGDANTHSSELSRKSSTSTLYQDADSQLSDS